MENRRGALFSLERLSFRTVDALKEKNYRFLWTAAWFWYTARWMELFLLALLMLQLTNSAFWVGLVSFLRLIPLPLLGVSFGTVSDRVERRGMLAAIQGLQLSAMALLTVLVLADMVNLWSVSVVALVMGIGFAGDYSARRPLIHDIMGPVRITNAMSLDLVALFGGGLIGPLVGGVLTEQLGIGYGFLAVTACYLGGLVALSFVARVPRSVRSVEDKMLRNLVQGLGHIRRNRRILGALVAAIVLNLLVTPYGQFVPLLARDVLNVGPSLAGLLRSAEGIGGLVGSLLLASRGNIRYHGRYFVLGLLGQTLAILLFALSPNYGLSFALVTFGGLVLAAYATMQFTLMLVYASKEMQGRAVGAMLFAMGSWSLGSLQMGALAGALGPAEALAISTGAALLLGMVILLSVRDLWRPTPGTADSPAR